jgi:zinc protease
VAVLKRNLAPAVAVLADVAQHPSFPADEIERERKLRLAELAQAETNPNQISARLSPMLEYGRNHPYGHPVSGVPSSVQKITREDLVHFHDTYWKPAGSALIFVGDITLAEATALASDAFGSWMGSAPVVNVPAPQPVGRGKIYLVNRPDAAQTAVAWVLPGPARSSSDYYALTLANTVWGGAAGARLGMNLREDKGYSYGVFSFPALNAKYGMWRAFGGVQTDKTKESVVEFEKELKFIAGEKPVSDKELADARNTRVRGYAQQFEAMSEVAGEVEELWNYGLPLTELQREPDELQKATLESVNAAAQKYARPSDASLLLVGDASKIESKIRELNLGEIVILDAEGDEVGK